MKNQTKNPFELLRLNENATARKLSIALICASLAGPQVFAGFITYELVATTGIYGNKPIGEITIQTVWLGDDHFNFDEGIWYEYSFSIADISFAGTSSTTNLVSGSVAFGEGEFIGDAVLTPTYYIWRPDLTGLLLFEDAYGNHLNLYADSIGNDWTWDHSGSLMDSATVADVDWYLKLKAITYLDSDQDGLTDDEEIDTYGTDPNKADTDSDGLNDYAEVVTHHTDPKVNDSDGDGFLDGYEVQTGHAPLIATDKPALVAEVRTVIEFTFPSALGKTYRIEGSPDLTNWTTVESGIAGNGAVIQRFYSTKDKPKQFLRVEEAAP